MVKLLLKDYKKYFGKVVTHTTRFPRRDEVNGTDYHFITRETFQELLANDFFMEHSVVHGNFYGVSNDAWNVIRRANTIPILEIDIQGTRQMKAIANQRGLDPVCLFIAPPNISMLEERLLQR